MRFNSRERELIRIFDTPDKIQRFLVSIPYTYEEDRFRSFRNVVKENTADCIEGAITAAAIMSARGHPPVVVDLVARNDCDHVIFAYKEHGKYGSVALSRDPNLYGRKPMFDTIEELAASYYRPYFADGGWLHSFAAADLDSSGIDWRFSKRDIFELEDFLDSLRHKRVKKNIEPLAIRKTLQAYYLLKRSIKKKLFCRRP